MPPDLRKASGFQCRKPHYESENQVRSARRSPERQAFPQVRRHSRSLSPKHLYLI